MLMQRRLRIATGWILALALAAGFAALGAWQLERMRGKEAMVDAAATARTQVLSLAEALQRDDAYLYARGQGRFLSGPPLLLDGRMRDGRAGVQVYRAFAPEGIERLLLVDLGWLPLPADRRPPVVAVPSGTHTVAGLLAPWPSSGLRMRESSQSSPDALLLRIDRATVERRLQPAVPVHDGVLRLDPALPIGYARDLDLLRNSLPPQRHLGYAVQWFALALAVLATAAVVTWRSRA